MRPNYIATSIQLLAILSLCAGCRGSENKSPEKTAGDFRTFSNIDKALKYSDGIGTTVAVIDWQFDLNGKAAEKYVHPTSMVPGENIGELEPWHGEWMAQIVHQTAPQAKIIPINARSLATRKYQEYLIQGIRFAADQGAVAVSSSMGPLKQCRELDDAVAYAEDHGTIFIDVHPEYVEEDTGKGRPCRRGECDSRILHTGIVSVPAHPTEPDSNRDIYTWPYDLDAKFQDGWGYSNAPPIVAGVIALIKSANPSLTTREVRSIIIETSLLKDGFRILDGEAAVKAALEKKRGTPSTSHH